MYLTWGMVEQARPLPMSVTSTSHGQYPAPLATYEEVVADRQLFMSSLEKLHSIMGTKFMIPIMGGKDLDLHKLFVEVTSRGGIEEVIRGKKWKEVTYTFNFPSTPTNASFVLRKYYCSLLQHYERIYYSKLPPPQAPSVPNADQPKINPLEFVSEAGAASLVGSSVIGVIDGKFDSGYLVTVKMGKDTLKGALYQAPQVSQPSGR